MLRRKSVSYLSQLMARPTFDMLGPICMTCGREVDREEMVEGEPGRTEFAKVLVEHHGSQELYHFDFGSREWDHDDLKRAMRTRRFFDPTKELEGSFAFNS